MTVVLRISIRHPGEKKNSDDDDGKDNDNRNNSRTKKNPLERQLRSAGCPL